MRNFSAEAEKVNSSPESQLPRNSQQTTQVDIFLMVPPGKDCLQHEVNCNCIINLKSLKLLINKIDTHCLARMD